MRAGATMAGGAEARVVRTTMAMEGGVEARELSGSTEQSMEGGSAKQRRRVLSVDATTWEKGRRRWSQRLTCMSHLMVHN